jgi:predicted transcriptional regulator
MSKQDPHTDLSRRERQIMDALYRLERASAADIRNAIPEPPSNTAVRTLLTILEEKGHVRFTSDGTRYIYEPVVSREVVAKETITRVVNNFFGGSIERVVATLVSGQEAELTDAQVTSLKAIIESARKRGK